MNRWNSWPDVIPQVTGAAMSLQPDAAGDNCALLWVNLGGPVGASVTHVMECAPDLLHDLRRRLEDIMSTMDYPGVMGLDGGESGYTGMIDSAIEAFMTESRMLEIWRAEVPAARHIVSFRVRALPEQCAIQMIGAVSADSFALPRNLVAVFADQLAAFCAFARAAGVS